MTFIPKVATSEIITPVCAITNGRCTQTAPVASDAAQSKSEIEKSTSENSTGAESSNSGEIENAEDSDDSDSDGSDRENGGVGNVVKA